MSATYSTSGVIELTNFKSDVITTSRLIRDLKLIVIYRELWMMSDVGHIWF